MLRSPLRTAAPTFWSRFRGRAGASGDDFIPSPWTWLGAVWPQSSRRLPRHLPIALLIFLSLVIPASASGDGYSVSVGVFSLFRPDRVEIETQQETMVLMQSGAIETQRVLVEGQRLQVERLGERLKVRFFERDGRWLHANHADSVRTQEAPFTLSVPGAAVRPFDCRSVGKDGLKTARSN